ncbi:unnamed protein product [Lactuca virosa]|uniref:Uncharacterized protein n=1 Tax=Lactuca virosa TaxID=75947 RepID=A0AAU9NYW3_9ASTR|nr:unnamed protein product [Lactuca virosa]
MMKLLLVGHGEEPPKRHTDILLYLYLYDASMKDMQLQDVNLKMQNPHKNHTHALPLTQGFIQSAHISQSVITITLRKKPNTVVGKVMHCSIVADVYTVQDLVLKFIQNGCTICFFFSDHSLLV